jgi:hypothetical protein
MATLGLSIIWWQSLLRAGKHASKMWRRALVRGASVGYIRSVQAAVDIVEAVRAGRKRG